MDFTESLIWLTDSLHLPLVRAVRALTDSIRNKVTVTYRKDSSGLLVFYRVSWHRNYWNIEEI